MKISKYLIHTEASNGNTLWYHPISKALIVLPVKYRQNQMSVLEKIDKKNLNSLREMMFVFPKDYNENNFYQFWYNNLKYSSKMLSFTIHSTFDCNMACGYCYEKSINNKKLITKSTSKDIVDFISKLVKEKKPSKIDIGYMGGEPLLTINQIINLAKKINKINVPVSSIIVTNGTMLNKENITKLKNVGVNSFQVTIDGPELIHDALRPFKNGSGTFKSILKNIKDVHQICNIILNINLNQKNIQSINEIFDFIKEQDIIVKPIFSVVFEAESGCFTYTFDAKKFKDAWLESHKLAIDYGYTFEAFYRNSYGPCTLQRDNYYIIDPEGYLYKCISGIGKPEYIIGHISDYNVSAQ